MNLQDAVKDGDVESRNGAQRSAKGVNFYKVYLFLKMVKYNRLYTWQSTMKRNIRQTCYWIWDVK